MRQELDSRWYQFSLFSMLLIPMLIASFYLGWKSRSEGTAATFRRDGALSMIRRIAVSIFLILAMYAFGWITSCIQFVMQKFQDPPAWTLQRTISLEMLSGDDADHASPVTNSRK